MHLKGVRFGFPLMKRIGLLKHHETYRVAWNRHPGVEIHYVLKGDIAWELKGRDRPLAISGGFFGIVPANARHRALEALSLENATNPDGQQSSDGSILDLAVACGFTSAAVFSSTFRKHVGMSPREFREASRTRFASSQASSQPFS